MRMPVKSSAPSCFDWSRGPENWGVTLRWNSGPLPAATASWCARGSYHLIITESEAGFGDPESAVASATQEPVLAGRPSAPGRLPGRMVSRPCDPVVWPTMRPGSMADLCSGIHDPYVHVGADILTPRISTTGADLNARSARAAFATVLLMG